MKKEYVLSPRKTPGIGEQQRDTSFNGQREVCLLLSFSSAQSPQVPKTCRTRERGKRDNAVPWVQDVKKGLQPEGQPQSSERKALLILNGILFVITPTLIL